MYVPVKSHQSNSMNSHVVRVWGYGSVNYPLAYHPALVHLELSARCFALYHSHFILLELSGRADLVSITAGTGYPISGACGSGGMS
jgi:hypothetical protein